MRSFFFVLIFFIFGCSNTIKLVDAFDNEKIEFIKNKQEKFSIDGYGIPTINININNKKFNFIVDTGAGMFLFFDKSYIETFNKNKENYFPFPKVASVKTPDKKDVKFKAFIIDSIKTNIFKAKNKVSMIMNNKFIKNFCNKRKEIAGIVGNDIFYSATNPIFFNFNDSIISLADKELYKSGFKKIESKFSSLDNKIKLKLFINNDEYWFIFDTGYSGTLHLNKPELKNTKYTIEEIKVFVDGKPKIHKIDVFNNVKIKLAETINLEGQIESSENVKFNLLGIKFMKNFDWIIDYKNKKVFFRPNNKFPSIKQLLNNRLKFKYATKIINGKLVISSKPINDDKYNIGDIIMSVDNTNINKDNICSYQQSLKNNNLSAMNLTIKGNIFN